MKILITGANGFIGKNLLFYLKNQNNFKIFTIEKRINSKLLEKKVISSDLIFHLAGVNRGNSKDYFDKNNSILTKSICDILIRNNKKTKIIFSSSIQANKKNYYGLSKKKAEEILLSYRKKTGAQVLIYRLPNVFGKWSKPHYNSAVATFCSQIYKNQKLTISDPDKKISLLYIDNLILSFLKNISSRKSKSSFVKIKDIFSMTLSNLVSLIRSFKKKEKTYLPNNISNSAIKSLYSTYISFFSKKDFNYKLNKFSDHRGSFSEFLKNTNFGQISFFSILPKQIRGNHYHNTKTEKFVVISGKARFNFVNIINKKRFSILTDENKNLVINTIPGWAHNIENIGTQTTKVLVWSNEILDKKNPDTFFYKV
jgi:UDP-2-acetamido-2,6-beta-L-arabino-hexul-4-ose reductase